MDDAVAPAGRRRRVLVLAYYFPPMGLSGVQRVAKFVKYLPEYGWQSTVLTSRPRGYFAYDTSLADDIERPGIRVHRTSSWDPTRLFSAQQTVALPQEARRKWFSWASQAVFIPDNKIGWLIPGKRVGRTVLTAQPHDVILASAPPYTSLLLGAQLSRQFNLPLVADFRDDWLGNPRHTYMTPMHRYCHRTLEGSVLRRCAHVLSINAPIRDSLANRAQSYCASPEFSVIPQGFDPSLLAAHAGDPAGEDVLRLVYTGVFYHAQSPDFFLHGLARMLQQRPKALMKIKADFVGLMPASSLELAHRLGLKNVVSYKGYQEHRKTIASQMSASVLWLTIGDQPGGHGISTGKLFEYMGTRKPILALVPDGAAAEVLEQYGASWIVGPQDIEGIASVLTEIYDRWEERRLPQGDAEYVQRFDRRVLAGELAQILENAAAKGAI